MLLLQAISQITIELLAPADPDGTGLAGQLREALQLARLTLFDMDVWVMGLVMLARRRVQASLWRNSQPAVVLALSTEALKKSLKEGISKSAGRQAAAESTERGLGDCKLNGGPTACGMQRYRPHCTSGDINISKGQRSEAPTST